MAVVGWLLFIILLPFTIGAITQNIGFFSLMIFAFIIASGLAELAKKLEKKEQIKKESEIISSKKWEDFDWDYK